jgi:hypothetical protein
MQTESEHEFKVDQSKTEEELFSYNWMKIKCLENLKTCDWSMNKSNSLACSICSGIGKLGPMVTQGLKLLNELVESSVHHYGDSKETTAVS